MNDNLQTSEPLDDGWENWLVVEDLCTESESSQDHGEDEDVDQTPETAESTVKTIAQALLMAENLKMFSSDQGLDGVYQHAMQLKTSLVNTVTSQTPTQKCIKDFLK